MKSLIEGRLDAVLVRLRALGVAVTVLGTTALAAIVPSSALASPVTTTFSYTGAPQTYTVPPGVGYITTTVTGGTGGTGYNGSGGQGAVVGADLPVTPGETLSVNVGGNGGGGASTSGGYNGGGNASGYNGGSSGGGSSDIRTTPGDPTTVLLVAGAGGGGGSGYDTTANGGDAGSDGQGADSYGQPGLAGTQSAGGTGGYSSVGGNGGDGSFAQGGNAGLYFYPPYEAAGGGGGGYYGGGGGGSFAGGGGGSNFFEPAAYATSSGLDPTATPSVIITPDTPGLLDGSPSALTFPATSTQGTSAPQTVTLTNTGPNPTTITGETFDYSGGQQGDDYFVSSSTCGGAIPAGGTCTLQVRFNPQGTGASSSGMYVQSSNIADGNGLILVGLSGTATGLPQGPIGPQGPTGTTGPPGNPGTTGSTGPAGSTGPTGSTGANGTNGATGATGANGATGATGATGGAGLAGKNGKDGTNGTNGKNGKNGRNVQTHVRACHFRGSEQRQISCSIYYPAAAGARVTATSSLRGHITASGTTAGNTGRKLVVLLSAHRMLRGTYMVRLSYERHGVTHTVRQAVFVALD